jgi:hypothetical protein
MRSDGMAFDGEVQELKPTDTAEGRFWSAG